MRVGGRAEWLLEPADPHELRRAWCEARERGLPIRLLGGGANLIVGDGVLPGVVLTTDRMRRVFRPLPPGARAREGELDDAFEDAVPRTEVLERCDDPRLVAWAGATLPGLVRTASDLGWSGLEGLVGVPGSLGGGVAMNAGGAPGCVWDVVDAVRVLADGEFRDLLREDCAPRYRDGGLGDVVVTGAVLRLAADRVADVRERTREFLLRKRAVQPVTEWSAGCIFRNPDPELSDGRSAGQLVDTCGGKSLERGDAVVSPVHANYVINRGAATAADVLALIEDVRELVASRTGIQLEVEVKIWRADDAVG